LIENTRFVGDFAFQNGWMPPHGIHTVMVLPLNFFPLKILHHGLFGKMKIIALWPNLEPASIQQEATLKSCSNNIKADMASLL